MEIMNQLDELMSGMQFPSHVTTPCVNPDVVALSREIVDMSRDTNNVLASGKIHYFVRNHYVDPSNGTYGIESLVRDILKARQAVFPSGIENTELRSIAIAGAMFTDEIIAQVRETFGADRYPDGTIRMYLSKFSKQFGKIKLSSNEDSGRPCQKPRCKWYVKE